MRRADYAGDPTYVPGPIALARLSLDLNRFPPGNVFDNQAKNHVDT